MSAIQRAIEAMGTQKALADAIGVAPAIVSQWVSCARRVAPKHCIPIERSTNGAVTRYELCPEVFGPAPGAEAA